MGEPGPRESGGGTPPPMPTLGPRGKVGIIREPLRSFQTLTDALGPVWRLRMFGDQYVVLNDPALVSEALQRHDRDLVKDDITLKLRRALGDGLLTSANPKWIAHRRLIAPSFTPQHLSAYADTMVDCAERLVARLGPGPLDDLRGPLGEHTVAVVSACLFGANADEAAARVYAALNAMLDRFTDEQHTWRRLLPESILERGRGRFEGPMNDLDTLLLRFIAEQRARGGDDGTLLARLLAARDDAGRGFTDQELRDESITLFAAGAETTALALANTIVLLDEHPEVRAQVEEELDTVLEGRRPTLPDLHRMVHLKRVISESLRLHTPAWAIGRRAIRPFVLGPWQIEDRDNLVILPWMLHRDPRWFPEPERFRPARWADDLARRLPRCAYMPFGAGPRTCVGNHFALMELQITLACLMQRRRVIRAPGFQWRQSPSVTLRQVLPVGVRIVDR